MNKNDEYEYMALALEVEKSIKVYHMHPSPNALISQISTEFSETPEYLLAISDIKSGSILFVRQHTIKMFLQSSIS